MIEAAKAWAAARELVLWRRGEKQCRSCDAWSGGAVLDTHCGALSLCWECLPVPGSPLANWEHWAPAGLAGMPEACVVCGTPMELLNGKGGSWMRGGPFCWTCPRPDAAAVDAWLLALRTAPTLQPPWAKGITMRA